MDVTATSTITKESSEFFDYLELYSNLSSPLPDFSTSFCRDWNDSVSFAQLVGVLVGSKVPEAMKCPRKVRDKSVGAVSCLVTVCMQQVLRWGAEPGRRTVLFLGRGCMHSVEFHSSRLRFSKIWPLTLYQTLLLGNIISKYSSLGQLFLCIWKISSHLENLESLEL